MLHIYMIAVMGIVVLRDSMGGSLRAGGSGDIAYAFNPWLAGLALGQFVVIAAVTHLVCWACGKEIDRRGSWRAVRMSERMIDLSRLLAVLAHAVSVLAIGWLGQVRSIVGDTIVLDEALAILPPVLTFVAGWWSFYPIEARLRGTVWIRVLEEGQPAYPTQTRWQYVISNVRHQILFTLVPLLLIGGWAEGIDRLLHGLANARYGSGMFADVGRWLHQSEERLALIAGGARLVGVAAVFAIAPMLMRYLWDTVRLGDGPLRERLLALCARANVRVRELLVWRTHGTMINGAAMGLIAPLRYILLTDALLDHMPQRQVEGVMAHEIGHARHHHIPWLVLGLIASIGFGSVLAMGAIYGLAYVFAREALMAGGPMPGWLVLPELILTPITLVIGFLGFGMISRRFEWQADAFAVQSLTKDVPEARTVSPEAVDAMSGALETVSRLNHIGPEKWSFRHGSIGTRQRRLQRLIGLPVDRVPIDRTVRGVKALIVVGVLLVVGALMAEIFLMRSSTPSKYELWPQSEIQP